MSQESITITWEWEDVQQQRPDLNKEKCCEVLSLIEAKHDANFGINCDIIALWAEELYPEEEEEEGENA